MHPRRPPPACHATGRGEGRGVCTRCPEMETCVDALGAREVRRRDVAVQALDTTRVRTWAGGGAATCIGRAHCALPRARGQAFFFSQRGGGGGGVKPKRHPSTHRLTNTKEPDQMPPDDDPCDAFVKAWGSTFPKNERLPNRPISPPPPLSPLGPRAIPSLTTKS